MVGRPIITVSSGHGKVFIPQAMVELDEQINGGGGNKKRKRKKKQREDHMSADKGVQPGGPSTDRQDPAAQQNYPKSSSHLGRQSSSTQDPYQLSHSQPSSVPLQGDWSSPLVIGSAVILNPPMCGTIRWIGTISQVQGYVAGVELVSTCILNDFLLLYMQ